mgnify:CR=1 FL=1
MVAIFSLIIYGEPKVGGYGRFSEISNTLVYFPVGFNLFVWSVATIKLIPKNHVFISIFGLFFSSLIFWLTIGEMSSHERQFYNTFLLFNAFGVVLFLLQKHKAHGLQTIVSGVLYSIILVGLFVKPIGLSIGIKSKHDFKATDYMYYDEAKTIVKSKNTHKGYDEIGERLEYHKNGKLKYYENKDFPEDFPRVSYYENGNVEMIHWNRRLKIGQDYVKTNYSISFDEKGMPKRESYGEGPTMEYHYNGFVFSTGQNKNGEPSGKWYWYTYIDGGRVVDSIPDISKSPNGWDRLRGLRANRLRNKDTATYKVRYDQKLMNGASHYRPDSIYEFALDLKNRFDQKVED